MATWTAKDPDAVQDYLYTIPLDGGDTVASATFEKLSGDVEIDNDPENERDEADITVWLSGGTDGETNVFRVAWVTTAGREDDEIITLAIIANEHVVPLDITGYTKPHVMHLVTRYPAFADVEPTTIAFWLTDAERYVDESWSEGDYAAALMALAAHNMAIVGFGAQATMVADLPAGVTGMKSGSLSLSFSDAAARDQMSGAYGSTRYGAEYAMLLRRNRAGPRVMPTGTIPAYPIRRNLLGDV